MSKNEFKDSLKEEWQNILNEREKQKEILKLQRLFQAGKIKEENLTDEQYEQLNKWYDEHIYNIKKAIERNHRKYL